MLLVSKDQLGEERMRQKQVLEPGGGESGSGARESLQFRPLLSDNVMCSSWSFFDNRIDNFAFFQVQPSEMLIRRGRCEAQCKALEDAKILLHYLK